MRLHILPFVFSVYVSQVWFLNNYGFYVACVTLKRVSYIVLLDPCLLFCYHGVPYCVVMSCVTREETIIENMLYKAITQMVSESR